MDATKIRLSPEEEAFVTNADFILTKNNILSKIQELLLSVQTRQQNYVASQKQFFPEAIILSTPKISRGEKYKGLPYLVADYPRVFSPEGILVIRNFFWWGNFFSTTLQLSGIYKNAYEKKIINSFSLLRKKDFFICINDDEWEHHFDQENYQSINDLSSNEFEKKITLHPFIKLAKKYPVEGWKNIYENLSSDFKILLNLLSH